MPLPVPCQEPLVPPAFPGTATPGCVCALFYLQRFAAFFSALNNGWEEAFHSFSLSLPQHNDGNGCVTSNSVGLQRDAVG